MLAKTKWHLTSLILLSVLTACSPAKQAEQQATTAPVVVQLHTVNQAQSGESFSFPAKVKAYRSVDIAFQVPGKIEKLSIAEGADIKQGELIAVLDQGPFQRNFRQSEVRKEQAATELARIRSLVKDKIASQKDLDNAQAAFDLAQIEWENRKADLNYSRLTAPFDAKVSQRYVEENSYVGVGTPIVKLQDVSKIFFEIQVPERLVSAYQGKVVHKGQARINGIDRVFDVYYAEHNTQPDPTTQTYQVEFAMDYPTDIKISTGINATIEVHAPSDNANTTLIPLQALVAETNDRFYVWRYQADKQVVNKAYVTVGPIQQRFVPVLSGLNTGDQIVVAGVAKMRDDLNVTPYRGE